jgi:hypothetical protein
MTFAQFEGRCHTRQVVAYVVEWDEESVRRYLVD